MMQLGAARLFDGQNFFDNCKISIENGFVVDVLPGDGAGHGLVVPGFVDLQVNGGGGVLFNDDISIDGLHHIAAAHGRAGTTTLLPTLISGSRAAMAAALAAVKAALDQRIPGVAGVHLEGPFLSPARPGIHPPEAILAMRWEDVAAIRADFPVLLTLAPERVDPAMIRALADAQVIVFAGHTDATWAEFQAGITAGVVGVTHLFNAMSQFASRAPGVVGGVLGDAAICAGIIVDGHHAHFASVRAAHAALGKTRLFLVSDAMATAGSALTTFRLGGKSIRLQDGKLTDESGTLAGAHLTMADAIGNAVHGAGIPLADALAMATSTPACVLGRRDIGRIAPGCRADLVALDERLNVVQVWQGGAALPAPPAGALRAPPG
jgi:N-acetylglucosamine-6-phosphate deacetylase